MHRNLRYVEDGSNNEQRFKKVDSDWNIVANESEREKDAR